MTLGKIEELINLFEDGEIMKEQVIELLNLEVQREREQMLTEELNYINGRLHGLTRGSKKYDYFMAQKFLIETMHKKYIESLTKEEK